MEGNSFIQRCAALGDLLSEQDAALGGRRGGGSVCVGRRGGQLSAV